MSSQNRPPQKSDNRFQQLFRNSFFPAIFLLIILYFLFSGISTPGNEIDYSKFRSYVKEKKVSAVTISKNTIEGEYLDSAGKKTKFTTSRVEDDQLITLLEGSGVDYKGENRSFGITQFIFTWVLPFVLLFAFWSYILRRMGGAGEQVISFGKNRAKLYNEVEEKTTF